MMFTSYKIDKVHFCLLGTNGSHVKAENERFTVVGWHCRQNLKYENFDILINLADYRVVTAIQSSCLIVIK